MLNFFRQTSSACAAMNDHRAQVQQALDTLASGLRPWVTQAMSQRYGQRWYLHRTVRNLYSGPDYGFEGPTFDLHLLLRIVLHQPYWRDIFRSRLASIDYATVLSLLQIRNRYAHYDGTDLLFQDSELVEQVLITIKQVLRAIGKQSELAQVQSIHDQLRPSLRQRLWQTCQNTRQFWQPAVIGVSSFAIALSAIAITSPSQDSSLAQQTPAVCPR